MTGVLVFGSGCRSTTKKLPLLFLVPSITTCRALSLNSAIGKGLRKSQGVGFRGKERLQARYNDFGGENRAKSIPGPTVRRTADSPVVSSMTRARGRGILRHERRAALRAASEATTPPVRIRRGKKVLRDPEAPPKRRSRAARFNDPDYSFGSRSKPAELRSKQFPSGQTSENVGPTERRRQDEDAGPLKGRKRPLVATAKQRANVSDRVALQKNPGGARLSKGRMAYLEKTANGPPRAEDRARRPEREPFVFARKGNELQSSSVIGHRDSDKQLFRSRSEPDLYQRGRSSLGHETGNPNYSDHRDEALQAGYRKVSGAAGERHSKALKLDSATSTVRPSFSQSQSKRFPISISYTTPASEFLYGTSVVEAALTSRRNPRRKIYKLYLYTGENRENVEKDATIASLARKQLVEVVRVGTEDLRLLDKMSSGRPHNGYVLECSPLPRLPVTALGPVHREGERQSFDVVLAHQSREDELVNGTDTHFRTPRGFSGRKPFVLFLDSVVDPGNLGGIIRTASFLGVTAIAISVRNSAQFTPVVLKASAGASENITLFTVDKTAGFITDSKQNGWKIYAAVAPSGKDGTKIVTTTELDDPLVNDPCILMLGNEGEGLRWNLRSKADVELAIQGSSNARGVDSLNVSVATGILCNAFLGPQLESSRQASQHTVDRTSAPVAAKMF